ncbi:hypothetical protein ASF71_14955 [Deinococcus sp. Leaf326]|nr:hypothetical protein ASF71_14955 [Deinococcus sp. Leaf326]
MLHWLIEYNGGMKAVEKNSGISRQTLRRYVRGRTKSVQDPNEKDLSISTMTPPTLGKLLDAFSLTDSQARELFGLPADTYPQWLTYRPFPVGSGAPLNPDLEPVELSTYSIELTEPLLAPRGMVLELAQLEETTTDDPWVVVRLGEARYVLRHAAVPTNLPIEGRLVGLR